MALAGTRIQHDHDTALLGKRQVGSKANRLDHAGGPPPEPDPLREKLLLNELFVNPVTTDNIPDGIVNGGDSAAEMFNR